MAGCRARYPVLSEHLVAEFADFVILEFHAARQWRFQNHSTEEREILLSNWGASKKKPPIQLQKTGNRWRDRTSNTLCLPGFRRSISTEDLTRQYDLEG